MNIKIPSLTTKQRIIGVLVVILVVVVVGVFIVISEGKNTIKVFMCEGIISEVYPEYNITPQGISKKLESAEDVGAVVLRINSPGGSVVASQEILDRIERFKEEFGLPVVVSMGEIAASGGYYIALGGDKIVANAGTLTGSIGVISQFIYTEELYKKIGLEQEIVKSGKYKGMGVAPLSPEERGIMQTLSDNIYEQFVREVANKRGLDIEVVKDLATGEVYTGEQAKALGLVDEIGTLGDAILLAVDMAGIEDPDIRIKSSGSGLGVFGVVGELASFLDELSKGGLSVRW